MDGKPDMFKGPRLGKLKPYVNQVFHHDRVPKQESFPQLKLCRYLLPIPVGPKDCQIMFSRFQAQVAALLDTNRAVYRL